MDALQQKLEQQLAADKERAAHVRSVCCSVCCMLFVV